ncbi:MAG: phosphoribosylglycinamide formyltransferase [Dysgonamonadaceae bacterium]|jgi:phosphoribosylglycinamide formyltransferase-1|nr:phosphoribosylglycinamide formyltransferase [Dysgonamonadaceae bacterium]
MKKIALLASGSGSNVENIICYFRNKSEISFFVLSNKEDAYVHQRAKKLNILSYTINKNGFETGKALMLLKENKTDFIVLAGFLLKVPEDILKNYQGRIINIHPALLPKYGGKGMYGSHVHEAVVANKETESGITIHHVNENYDEGQIIFQSRCVISPADTPEDVAAKVHALEYEHFPKIIEQIIERKN